VDLLTDIRVPLPLACETRLDTHRHLGEISQRLTDNLRVRLGDDFEVLRDVRPVLAGGQWSRATRVYRHGELRATFRVTYDYVMSPHDFEVSCQLTVPATRVPKAVAAAACLVVGGGAAALAGPLAGALAAGSTLLAASLAGRPLARRRARRQADGEIGLAEGVGLDPLLG